VNLKELKALTQLALKAALLAGGKILEVYENTIDVDYKEDGSPLTLADRASHESIVESLRNSHFPILSEEGKEVSFEERKKWKNYWLVDPLDGTKEFIKRNGEFTVNIAFMENGRPLSGVIYQPVSRIAYAGVEGDGLYKFKAGDLPVLDDSNKQKPLTEVHKDKIRIVASRTHKSQETDKFIIDAGTKSKNVELLNAGSSLKFCLIAEGSADIYPRFAPTMEWDTAAGHALLKSIGKNIYIHPSGNEMTYNKPQLINDWFIAR
jgi:3'(2'), 5'-bisphosphate nucleotidase